MAVTYRDLTTLDDFAQVVELEREIWGIGYSDVVPVPIFVVTVKRGGILVGAFHGDRLVAFVYSLAAMRGGNPTQWSHMLGVVDDHRNAGHGRLLKMRQRERALAMGLDLIEWTYDPLQALNAHLNFTRLGVVVNEYEENVYGASTSPLHRGNPTDRFVAEWWIRTPHVERRVAAAAGTKAGSTPADTGRSFDEAGAARANRATPAGEWLECREIELALETPRVTVEIPIGFTDMLSRAPELAQRWRLVTRDIFTTYFGRGYRAVDFSLDRRAGKGAYVLVTQSEEP